jgi:hypothetical protein
LELDQEESDREGVDLLFFLLLLLLLFLPSLLLSPAPRPETLIVVRRDELRHGKE